MLAIVNGVVPIFAIIALGTLLKRLRITDDSFLAVADRLIYYIFLPALLFWKTGKPAQGAIIEWNLIGGVLVSVLLVFVLSHAYVRFSGMAAQEVGSFSQGCYRFNTYIGIAAILSALGDDGIRLFGVLIGFVIPFINVLAVGTLIWFSGSEFTGREKAVLLVKAMVSNPLILACLSGLLYSSLNTPFPVVVDSTLGLLSMMTLPLALISIGGSLTFNKFAANIKYASVAALFKLVVLPLLGLGIMLAFEVSGTPFKVAMLFFALPTSPASYILSEQLNSNVDLATSAIVLSTILSIISLSVTVVAVG